MRDIQTHTLLEWCTTSVGHVSIQKVNTLIFIEEYGTYESLIRPLSNVTNH